MRCVFALLCLSSLPCVALAQSVDVSLLIDRTRSGGCTVAAVDTISGVDARLTASVDSAAAQVDALTLETCDGGSFGTPQTLASGYPVGLNNGEAGADVIELTLEAAQVVAGSSQFAVTALADDGVSIDQATGGIVGISVPMPVDRWALGVLAIALGLMAAWALRRHRAPAILALSLVAAAASAAHFALDGAISDWTGVAPASDPAGDPTAGGSRADILAVYAAEEDGRLWFRVDLADIENTAPNAADDAFATDEDAALSGENVLADNGAGADSDPEGDTLTVTGFDATSAEGAAVNIAASGALDYDPAGASALQALAPGDSADDTFTYTIEDPDGRSATATVTVTVAGVNDAPSAADDAFATDEDVELVVAAPGVLENDDDVDTGDTVTAVLDSGVSDGTLALNADGSFTYDPDPDFNGTDEFTYHATDGSADTTPATVTISVSAVNDPPAASNDSFTVDEDTTANALDVLANDTDAPDTGETLTITAVGTPDQGGTATTDGSIIDYAPAPDFTGVETFSYTIGDGNGGNDTATVEVTVDNVADAPVCSADTGSTDEDSSTSIDVLANDSDADPGQTATLTVSGVDTTGTTGAVTNNGTDVTYDPNGQFESLGDGEEATDTFAYTTQDADGLTCTETVAVTITGVNDAPTATGKIFDVTATATATNKVLGDGMDASPF